MSQENVEAVRRTNEPLQGIDVAPFIRAALAGNLDDIPPDVVAGFAAWLNLFDPNVEIDTSRVNMPGFGVFQGLDGVRQLFARWIEEWEHYSWVHGNLSDAGDHVILDSEIHATGASSGVEVVWTLSQTYTFRDGKVIRWCVFEDRASALAAIEHLQPTAKAQQNVDAFLRDLDAFQRGDFKTWVENFAEDGEFIPQKKPAQGSYRGRTALWEFLEDNAESFDLFHPTYDFVHGVGDRVIALGKTRLRGRRGGAEIEVPSAVVVTYRDGQVVRFEDFMDRRKAFEAVGLSDAAFAEKPTAAGASASSA
jgi:ketosteroid isomerase-like protein